MTVSIDEKDDWEAAFGVASSASRANTLKLTRQNIKIKIVGLRIVVRVANSRYESMILGEALA